MSDTKKCTICFDDDSESRLLYPGCDEHGICQECLIRMVKIATNDERHYPLSCPGGEGFSVSDEKVFRLLRMGDADLEAILDAFYEKLEEYKVPSAARIYCADRKCQVTQGHSRFLNAEINGEAMAVVCPDCGKVTCRLCRNARAGNQPHFCEVDGQTDKEILAVIELLPEEDRWLWHKCFACGIWVNKSDACNQ